MKTAILDLVALCGTFDVAGKLVDKSLNGKQVKSRFRKNGIASRTVFSVWNIKPHIFAIDILITKPAYLTDTKS